MCSALSDHLFDMFNKGNALNYGCMDQHHQSPGSETKCGTLVVGQGEPSRPRRLVVKVHGRAIDPFVVFYQEKKFCNSCGFLKLRNCRVDRLDNRNTRSFIITPKDGDGNPLVFTAESEADRDDWVAALRVTPQSPLRSATSILPRLEELTEELEEDDDDDVDCRLASDCLKTRSSRRKSIEIRKNSLTNLGLGLNRHTLNRLQRLADTGRSQE